METNTMLITRSDVETDPVNKGELIVLLDHLKNTKLNNVNIGKDFLMELVKMSIDSFEENTGIKYGGLIDG